MKLRELPSYLDIDINESLAERFMDSEELYIRFLRRLAADDGFAALRPLAVRGDWAEALRRAHNLKGLCGSLGLLTLQRRLAELVALLRRQPVSQAQVLGMLAAIEPEWRKTLRCIEELA